MNNLNELLSREYWMQYLELATEGGLTDGAIANDIIAGIEKAINYSRCCKTLKDNEKLSFRDWKHNKGIRYLSGHTYKDNDGYLYDSDELEKMYESYINL